MLLILHQVLVYLQVMGVLITALSGCTDPLANNYDAQLLVMMVHCTYAVCDAKPTGLNAYDITDTRFRLGWDNMNNSILYGT